MAYLKIPIFHKNSDKTFFKKGLNLKRKSKSKLIKESFFMLFLGSLLIYFNYIIPNKISILRNLVSNFGNLVFGIMGTLSYFYEICLAIFIIISIVISLILFLGSLSRMYKVLKNKPRIFKFK